MGGFYWHSCNIRNSTNKGSGGWGGVVGVGGSNKDPGRKKTPRGSSHVLNKSPHQSQTTIEYEANIYIGDTLDSCHPIKAHLCWLLIAHPRKMCRKADLAISC